MIRLIKWTINKRGLEGVYLSKYEFSGPKKKKNDIQAVIRKAYNNRQLGLSFRSVKKHRGKKLVQY
jgi:hypothetical protein